MALVRSLQTPKKNLCRPQKKSLQTPKKRSLQTPKKKIWHQCDLCRPQKPWGSGDLRRSTIFFFSYFFFIYILYVKSPNRCLYLVTLHKIYSITPPLINVFSWVKYLVTLHRIYITSRRIHFGVEVTKLSTTKQLSLSLSLSLVPLFSDFTQKIYWGADVREFLVAPGIFSFFWYLFLALTSENFWLRPPHFLGISHRDQTSPQTWRLCYGIFFFYETSNLRLC